MITQKQVEEKLRDVMDPELNLSIMELGLVYKVTVTSGKVSILMTLTSLGCPLFDSIQEEIHDKLASIGIDQKNVEIKLTFDPPWSMDRMSPSAKAMLGI